MGLGHQRGLGRRTMLHANINPQFGTGQDSYTDYAIDGGYQFLGAGQHIVTAQGTFVHETQNLTASSASYNAANGTSLGSGYGLNTINLNVQYWYQNTYGATVGWFAGFGSKNPIAYQTGAELGADFVGFANNSPNYNGFSIEADWVPFGKDDFPVAALGQSEDRRHVHVVYRLQWRQFELRRPRPQRLRQQRLPALRLDHLLIPHGTRYPVRTAANRSLYADTSGPSPQPNVGCTMLLHCSTLRLDEEIADWPEQYLVWIGSQRIAADRQRRTVEQIVLGL